LICYPLARRNTISQILFRTIGNFSMIGRLRVPQPTEEHVA
jgi:hypothetical protein